MELVMKNRAELTEWLNKNMEIGKDFYAVKGDPPKGATYDGVRPLVNQVNVAWVTNDGDRFDIIYEGSNDDSH